VITAGLRRAILAAAGLEGAEDGDPLLRPGPVPGSYASSLPFRLARPGQNPREEAAALAADGTSPGYDFHADADYRAHLARVLTKRALEGKTG